MAPKENMKAEEMPLSLISPNKKLLSPRDIPAKKLGIAKNFFCCSERHEATSSLMDFLDSLSEITRETILNLAE